MVAYGCAEETKEKFGERYSLNWANMVTGQASSFSCLFSLQFGVIDFLWALVKILGPHKKFSPLLSLTNNTHFYFRLFIFQSPYSTSNQTYPYCNYWTTKKQKKCINIRKVMLVDNLVFDFELIVSFIYLLNGDRGNENSILKS